MFTFKFNNVDGMISLNDDFIYIKLIVNDSVVKVYEKKCIRQNFNAPEFFKLTNIYDMMHECINKKNYDITLSNEGAHILFNICHNEFIKLQFNMMIGTKTMKYGENYENEMTAQINNLNERVTTLEINQHKSNNNLHSAINNTQLVNFDIKHNDQHVSNELKTIINNLINKTNEMEEMLKNSLISVYSNTQSTGTYKLYDKHISLMLIDNRCTVNFGCINAFKKLETLNIHIGQMNLSKCCDNKCMESMVLCSECKNDNVQEIILRHDGIRSRNTLKFKMFNLENFPNLQHLRFELTRVLPTDEILSSLKKQNHNIKQISFKTCHINDIVALQSYCLENRILISI